MIIKTSANVTDVSVFAEVAIHRYFSDLSEPAVLAHAH